jgi:hypothetical protein
MMITNERRTRNGVAIVTQRPDLKVRYTAAGIPCGVYAVQPNVTWPAHRPPVVLDTIGMPPAVLTQLLATAPAHPLIAIAEAHDYRALRLCAWCPTVQMIGPDEPALVRRWLRHLAGMVPHQTYGAPIAWLMPPPRLYRLEPSALPILAALLSSPSISRVAERVGMPESSLHRQLRKMRMILDLPLGARARYRPEQLGMLILARLGADAPVRERSVRGG